MFTDIYVSIQGGHVLQERWLEEANQTPRSGLIARLRRAFASN